MAYNPNAIFISPSTIADFNKCPQLYFYRNVYRSPRGLKIQIINPNLALGQAIHDTLEIFVRLPVGERTKDQLLSKFEFSWSSLSGEKGGFSSEIEEKEYRNRALAMLERFYKNKHFQEAEMVKIPGFPKLELGNDIILTGKLDWLEKDERGYHLIDFKTGKNEEKESSQQLPIYAVLVNGIFKGEEVRASFWYLGKDDDFTPFTLPEVSKTTEYLKNKGEIIKMVRQTQSFRCQSGGESCWACRDMLAIAQGKGKLVNMDPVNRKQEIYILPKGGIEIVEQMTVVDIKKTTEDGNDLPF